jgi:hypothetical protein
MSTKNWESFSIFISSTFKDFHQERDYLNWFIFKKLSDELEQFRVHLNIVDLRWGLYTTEIDDEQEREKRILSVCIDEIKRCNPFFIAMLGNRYGWQPPKNRIVDFARELNKPEMMEVSENEKSVTHLEIEYGILQHADLLAGSITCFRKITSENQSGKLLSDYYDTGHKRELLDSLKNDLIIHYAKDHEILGQSDVIFEYDVKWDESTGEFSGMKEWAEKVIKAICSCKKYKEITKPIESMTWLDEEEKTFDRFIENHTRGFKNIEKGIIQEDTIFTGRDSVFTQLKKDIETSKSQRLIILTGESGIGKSAIAANLYLQLKDQKTHIVLGHSANISPKSSLLNLLMQKLIFRLLKHKTDQKEINSSLADQIQNQELVFENEFEAFVFLKNTLNGLLRSFPDQKIVLLIDAIDFLEERETVNCFSWIDDDIPENVRIICTAANMERFKPEKYHRSDFNKKIEISGLTEDEAENLVVKMGKIHNKQLEGLIAGKIKEMSLKLSKSNPLWINLSLTFLLSLDSEDFEKIEKMKIAGKRDDEILYGYIERVIGTLDPDCGKLFLQLLKKSEMIFGSDFVNDVFNFLAISRYGLRENDLRYLIDRNWERKKGETDSIRNEWNDLKFASLRRWFKPFLCQFGDEKRWNISHSVIRKAILDRMDKNLYTEYHYNIFKYLYRVIYKGKKSSQDTFFQSETYFHIYEMNNSSMGIKAFDLFDGKATQKAIEFIHENLENVDFYKWFLGLFDYIVTKISEAAEKKEKLLFGYCQNLIMEDIFRALFFKGKYALASGVINDLERILQVHSKLFSGEKFSVLSGMIEIRKIAVNSILEAYKKYGEQDIYNNDISGYPTIKKIAGFYMFLMNARIQEDPATASEIFDKAEQLMQKLTDDAGYDNVMELFQIYFEYRGDYFFDYVEYHPFERQQYLSEIETGYAKFKQLSEKLHNKFPRNPEFSARYARSLQRAGNLMEKFYLPENPGKRNKIAEIYLEENQICKELLSYYPENLSFRRDYANSAGDLARIYEIMEWIEESQNQHLETIYIYKNICSHEGKIARDIEMLCIAYENYAKFCYRQHLYDKCRDTCEFLITLIDKNRMDSPIDKRLVEFKTNALLLLDKISFSGN